LAFPMDVEDLPSLKAAWDKISSEEGTEFLGPPQILDVLALFGFEDLQAEAVNILVTRLDTDDTGKISFSQLMSGLEAWLEKSAISPRGKRKFNLSLDRKRRVYTPPKPRNNLGVISYLEEAERTGQGGFSQGKTRLLLYIARVLELTQGRYDEAQLLTEVFQALVAQIQVQENEEITFEDFVNAFGRMTVALADFRYTPKEEQKPNESIRTLEQANENLSSHKEKLIKHIEDLTSLSQEAHEKTEAKNSELLGAKKMIRKLQKENENLFSLSELVETQKEELNSVKEKQRKTKKTIAKLTQKNEALQVESDKIKEELKEEKTKAQLLQDDYNSLLHANTKTKDHKKMLADTLEEKRALIEKVKQYEEMVGVMKKEQETLARELLTNDTELRKLQIENARLKDSKKQIKAAIKKPREEVKGVDEQLSELNLSPSLLSPSQDDDAHEFSCSIKFFISFLIDVVFIVWQMICFFADKFSKTKRKFYY